MGSPFGAGTVTIYSTPQSLSAKIDEYFESCFIMKYDPKSGLDRPYEIKTPTYAGLARYLGFSSRSAMLNYVNEKNEEYSIAMADGLLRLEEYMETKLIHSKTPAGLIFALKNNAGWEEVSKKQITGSDNTPLMFSWASEHQTGDVLTIEAEKSEIKGALPPVPLEIEGTIELE